METQGSIGVTMHIDPDDDPIAGAMTNFYLWFKDTQGLLSAKTCTGTFEVITNGAQLVTRPLFPDTNDQSLSVTQSWSFPGTGVYKVRVSGMPNVPNGFQPFVIDFDIRVERTIEAPPATGTWFNDHLLHIGLGIVVVGVVLFLIIRRRRKPGS